MHLFSWAKGWWRWCAMHLILHSSRLLNGEMQTFISIIVKWVHTSTCGGEISYHHSCIIVCSRCHVAGRLSNEYFYYLHYWWPLCSLWWHLSAHERGRRPAVDEITVSRLILMNQLWRRQQMMGHLVFNIPRSPASPTGWLTNEGLNHFTTMERMITLEPPEHSTPEGRRTAAKVGQVHRFTRNNCMRVRVRWFYLLKRKHNSQCREWKGKQ